MTMLMKFNPWREITRAQEEMGRLLEDRFAFQAGESLGWTPATDIYEDEEGLTLRFELAGVEPKDVDIRFENGVLTIKGDRTLEKEDRRENYHRLELSYGAFNRASRYRRRWTRTGSRPARRAACSSSTCRRRPRRSPRASR
jgi:HSP20 family protein